MDDSSLLFEEKKASIHCRVVPDIRPFLYAVSFAGYPVSSAGYPAGRITGETWRNEANFEWANFFQLLIKYEIIVK